jgi:hypothetical protein
MISKGTPDDHSQKRTPIGAIMITPIARQVRSKWAKAPMTIRGAESRLTPQRPQYVEQKFGVPSGALAAALDGSFVGALTHQVEGEVADHGHVLGPMTCTQA